MAKCPACSRKGKDFDLTEPIANKRKRLIQKCTNPECKVWIDVGKADADEKETQVPAKIETPAAGDGDGKPVKHGDSGRNSKRRTKVRTSGRAAKSVQRPAVPPAGGTTKRKWWQGLLD